MKRATIPAAKAKAQLLSLLDQVERTRQEVVVTKRGRPVARLAPLDARRPPVKARARIVGDLVAPVDEGWEAP